MRAELGLMTGPSKEVSDDKKGRPCQGRPFLPDRAARCSILRFWRDRLPFLTP